MEVGLKIEMLRKMMLVRYFEDRWGECYRRGEMGGLPPSIGTGQEAISVGACLALERGDYVFTTHRGQAPQIAMGLDINRVMADLFYKRTGYNKGKSYHVTDMESGVVGMGGIVGAQLPVATGAALAFKLKGSRQLALCFFGEGASNEGAFHESLNLAAIWELPVIFLCENNLYAISLRLEEFVKVENIADRAAAYGMPGITVDGNDVVAVYEAVAKAAKKARKGQGPALVEAKTYRLAGHLYDDPQQYRSREEVDEKWQNCPIERFKVQLKVEGVLLDEEIERLEQEVKQQVESAVAFARGSPFPEPEEAFQDIFS